MVTVVSTTDLWLVEGASVRTLALCVVPTLLLTDGVTTDAFVPEVWPFVVGASSSTVAAMVATTRGPLLSFLVAGNVVWG